MLAQTVASLMMLLHMRHMALCGPHREGSLWVYGMLEMSCMRNEGSTDSITRPWMHDRWSVFGMSDRSISRRSSGGPCLELAGPRVSLGQGKRLVSRKKPV